MLATSTITQISTATAPATVVNTVVSTVVDTRIQADPAEFCKSPYLNWSFIPALAGTSYVAPAGTFTYQQCCLLCLQTAGCAYWYMAGGATQCFMRVQTGATQVGKCPNGVQLISYTTGPAPGWGPGPCGRV
jgi:hypothetical protein